MPVRHCTSCGSRVPLVARFCPYCGEELKGSTDAKPIPEFDYERKDHEVDGQTIAVIRFVGVIEARHARRLRELFDELDRSGVKRVVLCMRNVTYVSSAALGLLVSYASDKKMREETHSVFLADVSQAVGSAMSVLGIMPFFAIFPDVKSALAALGVEEQEEESGEQNEDEKKDEEKK